MRIENRKVAGSKKQNLLKTWVSTDNTFIEILKIPDASADFCKM